MVSEVKLTRKKIRRASAVTWLCALLALLLLLACGCDSFARTATRAVVGGSKPYDEWVGDPVMLSTVKSIAILPFEDMAGQKGFDAVDFSTRFANQLAARGSIRVVYPRQILEMVKRENAKINRHNAEFRRRRMLGLKPSRERANMLRKADADLRESVAGEEDIRKQKIDPVHNLNDALKIGRMLKVDGLIMGTLTDYDPYMRPRLSLSVRLVATGVTQAAAKELAELTQWGIPRGRASARGVVWSRQQTFDSRDGNIGRDAYGYALLHHTEDHAYDAEIYIRSMTMYYDFVTSVLSRAILKARDESVEEAEERAIAQAAKRRETVEGMRKRVRDLVEPDPVLPNADSVVSDNLGDRRSSGWRPDVYNRENPNKSKLMYGNGQMFE